MRMMPLAFLPWRSLLLAVVTLFGVAVISFVLLRVVPGDPVAMMIAPGASEADIAALRASYGLDRSIPVQFAIWLGHALTGDFGTSISMRQDVTHIIAERLPATIELALFALLVALALGIGTAVLTTLARRRLVGSMVDNANGILLAVPDFVWALAFVVLFGVVLPILPISGRVDPRLPLDFATPFIFFESLLRLRFAVTLDVLSHMIMPAMALALPLAAVILRVLKGALEVEAHQDYALLARIRGKSRLRVTLEETLRNALIPTLSLTGVQFTFLFGGTVIVERIFAYPGIGNLAIDAVINRDLPLIQGLILTFGLVFILINLAVEASFGLLNPRLRHG
ncbi:ABC transporter permease [Aurantimonas sp. VKM B-3413]|uniref:ABC transporter permease n=1 Tax=Aurantimonas sp. VKM B-3413 TaxID=2779401 RepID=UPI001E28B7FF|nr:ABC transporter permease [Aurantimonas sp. VKM B-3413]MCB8840312.1 ABC transporter permease [Aurantimonas sp. VKM B-3413]